MCVLQFKRDLSLNVLQLFQRGFGFMSFVLSIRRSAAPVRESVAVISASVARCSLICYKYAAACFGAVCTRSSRWSVRRASAFVSLNLQPCVELFVSGVFPLKSARYLPVWHHRPRLRSDRLAALRRARSAPAKFLAYSSNHENERIFKSWINAW